MAKKYHQVTQIRICIDEKKDNEIKGYLCGVALENKIRFISRQDFIFKVMEAYDFIGKPQSNYVLRSFSKDAPTYNSYVGSPKKYFEEEEIELNKGKEVTYDLVVRSKRNAEYQGLVKDDQGKVLLLFNTLFELLKVL